jgi:hypothetical protein
MYSLDGVMNGVTRYDKIFCFPNRVMSLVLHSGGWQVWSGPMKQLFVHLLICMKVKSFKANVKREL